MKTHEALAIVLATITSYEDVIETLSGEPLKGLHGREKLHQAVRLVTRLEARQRATRGTRGRKPRCLR